MSALMLANQALVGPGDRVVVVTPVWPNLVEIPRILGAEAVTFALDYTATGWKLNLQRLLATLTPATRMVCINSPNNPTGWTISRDEQRAILEHCRRHGIWILADDAYERLYYGGGAAPSFLDIADANDRGRRGPHLPRSTGATDALPRHADGIQHVLRAELR